MTQSTKKSTVPTILICLLLPCVAIAALVEYPTNITCPNKEYIGVAGGGHPMPDWNKPEFANGTHSVYNVTETVHTQLLFKWDMIDYHASSNCIEVKISNRTGEPVECVRQQTIMLPNAKGNIEVTLLERQNELIAEQNALLMNMSWGCGL